ncbi:MAG: hypothetical protein JRI68_19450 [Deltaproteobacteria bacterium]|nr:hypothetical protein [Deltaproteobacteria bacterium]
MRSTRGLPKQVTVTAATALLLLCPGAARADDDTVEVALGVVTLGGLAAADVAFAVHAAKLYVERGEADQAWAIAEVAAGAPQALFFQAFNSFFLVQERGDHGVKLIMPAPTMVTTAVTVHGIWSLARPDEAPGLLFVGSSMIAVNSTWTVMRLNNLFDGELRPWEIGWVQMVSTGPMVAWGAAEAARQESFRSGWIGLTLWSSALFMHGAAGVLLGEDGDDLFGGAARDTARALGVEDVSVVPVVPGAAGPSAGLALGGRF